MMATFNLVEPPYRFYDYIIDVTPLAILSIAIGFFSYRYRVAIR